MNKVNAANIDVILSDRQELANREADVVGPVRGARAEAAHLLALQARGSNLYDV